MTTLGQLGMQSVTLTPRFIFGINGQLSNNLHIVDEKKLLYVAGHNVIIYNIDEKTQHFIPGCEGTEGINAISVSQSQRYLAICERGLERAQCMIYEISAHKQRKILPEPDGEFDFKCKEFLDVAFDPKSEKNRLITLCGDPDWSLLLWRWDDPKIQTRIALNITNPEAEGTFQMSFYTMNTQGYLTVTGPSCYRYYQMADKGDELMLQQDALVPTDNVQLSDNYTCHKVMTDNGKTVVCTAAGEIILADYEGKYLAFIQESPGCLIRTVYTAQHGLVIAGENGYIWTYNAVNSPDGAYYQMCREMPAITDKNASQPSMDLTITSTVLSPNEDYLYYVTAGNQLERVPISFEGPSPGQASDVAFVREPVHSPFHPTAITGMDVCLRKQLIVTTSARHIYIWNYATKTLELKYECTSSEEAVAVAFHPSGFHIVVAFTDKIQLMNVLSNTIKEYMTITAKNCREVKFSNGGHMFAVAHGTSYVYIYNFYTGENPPNLQCKGHQNKVRGIDWFEDDMGFTSSALDGNVYFYDLMQQKEPNNRNSDKDFLLKNKNNSFTGFTDVANIPGSSYEALVCGGGQMIYRTKDEQAVDAGCLITQVKILASNKAFFAGKGDETKPGAVQIWKFPMEKLNEVQAHGPGGIERMRISYDNNFLFTAGKDGSLMVFDIKDKDPRGGLVRQREHGAMIPFSQEILTEKQEIADYEATKQNLITDLENHKNPGHSGVDEKMGASAQEERIKELQDLLASTEVQARNAHDHLNNSKIEMEEAFEKQIKQLEEQQHEELEARRNEYSQKMLEDAARYNDLSLQKEEEQRKFQKSQSALFEEHQSQVNEEQKNHNDHVEEANKYIQRLLLEIEQKKQDNEETMRQVRDDAESEIEDIDKKNKSNMTQVQEMGLKSKAELQLTKNKLTDLDGEIQALGRNIQDKEMQLQTQHAIIKQLTTENTQQLRQIEIKDQQIGEKEKHIYSQKKKTQELDKFKFVLDYKIKELKRDIAPREMQINKLSGDTNAMDQRLKKFNKVNANLSYLVDDLRTRQEQMVELIKKSRAMIRKNDGDIKRFKTAVYKVSRHIDDYDMLKHYVHDELLYCVKDQAQKDNEIDPDIKKEYENQKIYLESSVHSLVKRLEQETLINKKERLRIMVQNDGLIEQMKKLRGTVGKLNQQLKSNKRFQETDDDASTSADNRGGDNDSRAGENVEQEIMNLKQQIEMKQRYVMNLQQELTGKANEASQLTAQLGEFVNLDPRQQ